MNELDWQLRVPVLGETEAGAALLVTLTATLGARALKAVRGALLPWVVGLTAGLLVALTAPDTSIWLPAAVAVGTLVHLVGDLLTTDGIPFPTWPLVAKPPKRLASPMWQRSGDIALPLLGDAGSVREGLLGTALTVYAAGTVTATLATAPGLLPAVSR